MDNAVTGFISEARRLMEASTTTRSSVTARIPTGHWSSVSRAAQFDRINVVYGNHNSEPLPFRFRVAPGGGREIDLRGGERDIAYVEFWYQKASWGSKPEVRLYGKP